MRKLFSFNNEYKMKKSALLSIFIIVIVFNLKAQESKVSDSVARRDIWEKISAFFTPPKEYKNNYGSFRSPLKFYDGRAVKTANDWKERRREIFSQWNKMMGQWPPLLKDQQMQLLDSTRRDGFTQYAIRFNWTLNEETNGYLLIPDGNGKKPAVITVFYEPQTAVGLGTSEQTKATCDFAYQLAKRGYVPFQ
jgi:hypothetical protein